MKVKHILTVIICALLALSCSEKGAQGKPLLSVSVAPQKYLLSAIVDSLYDINVLIPSGAEAETFDPSMQALEEVSRSRAFFSVGAAGFEQATVDRLRKNFPGLRIVDSSKGIDLIRGTHTGDEPDPHIWSSVRNARAMAATMREEMCNIDPANAATFQANWQKLDSLLLGLDREIGALTAKGPKSFAVWHPALSYFARDYGLTQLPLEEHGREASPRQYMKRLEAIKASPANTFIADPDLSPQKASQAAKEAGLDNITTVNLSTESWPDEMRKLARALSR